jgi:hypothetical protein
LEALVAACCSASCLLFQSLDLLVERLDFLFQGLNLRQPPWRWWRCRHRQTAGRQIAARQWPELSICLVSCLSRTLRNAPVIIASVVVLAGLGLGGGWSWSKIRIHSKQSHLPSGLVALWSGEGNANDSAGGDNGELTGDATFEKGKVGQAFSLDGTRGTSVDVGNPVQLQLQDFTITAWIKRDNTESVSADFPRAVIFGYGQDGYALYMNSSGVPLLSKYNVHGGETKSRAAIKDTNSQTASAAEPYKILHITQTNGTGGIDYVIADSEGTAAFMFRAATRSWFSTSTLTSASAPSPAPAATARWWTPRRITVSAAAPHLHV